jgi:glycine cleavage system aminomethyltransferase T
MSLDFLGITLGAIARSPLSAGTAAAGARFELRDGWEVAVRFAEPKVEMRACREQVGWADVSHLRKFELQGASTHLEAARTDHGVWLPLTPERALLVDGPAPREAGVRTLEITSQLAALRVVGPLARELFASFCALDLRPSVTPRGAFRPGSVARTPGYVLCEAPDRYLMLFGAAYGAYMWDVVCDAGAQLGGRPVGTEALLAGQVGSHA